MTNDGSLQVDPPCSAAEGSQGAIIWPGRQMASHEVVDPQSPYAAGVGAAGAEWSLPIDPAGVAMGAAGPETPLGGVLGQMWPSTLFQNEAGSLVVPHTWRYIPAPPQAPSPGRSEGPLSPPPCGPASDSVGQVSPSEEQSPSVAIIMPVADQEADMARQESAESEARPPSRPLDLDAKRQLLTELVECLTVRAHKAEQSLGAEQRSNRALNVTMEVLQRQNLCLQQQCQQLAYMAQQWPYGYMGQEGGESAAFVVTSAAADAQGALASDGVALPVETAVRLASDTQS